jgi:hypothetical protein
MHFGRHVSDGKVHERAHAAGKATGWRAMAWLEMGVLLWQSPHT